MVPNHIKSNWLDAGFCSTATGLELCVKLSGFTIKCELCSMENDMPSALVVVIVSRKHNAAASVGVLPSSEDILHGSLFFSLYSGPVCFKMLSDLYFSPEW